MPPKLTAVKKTTARNLETVFPFLEFEYDDTNDVMLALKKQYGFTAYCADSQTLTSEGEDFILSLRVDNDAEGQRVFKAWLTTFAPRDDHGSAYHPSAHDALDELAELLQPE